MAKTHVFEPLLRPSGDRSLRLVNKTRGLLLAEQIETAFDSNARRKGLLGRDSLEPHKVLAIAPSNAIHTFGMGFAIDVLFINRRGQVVKRVSGLGTRRLACSLRAFAVLEFASPSAAVAATAVGDLLAVE